MNEIILHTVTHDWANKKMITGFKLKEELFYNAL